MESRFNAAHILLAALGGAAAGIGVALLTAPRSGVETRAYIADRARDGRDAIKEKARSVADKFGHTAADKAKDVPQAPSEGDAYHAAAMPAPSAFETF